MLYWWNEIEMLNHLAHKLNRFAGVVAPASASIHPTALLDFSKGPIVLGENVRICEGVSLTGPLVIEDNTLVGKNAQVRGPCLIGRDVLIGYNVEVKRSILHKQVKLGPGSYVGDSFLEQGVFLGALVRTSNYRLDGENVQAMHQNQRVDTGMDKLGCLIRENTSLGIGCKIYPGREVPANSLFEMDVHIKKNLPPGHYRIKQELELV